MKELNYLEDGKGIKSWLFTTDHKRIALLYLFTMLLFFSVGVTIGILMRIEQLTIGPTIMSAKIYNMLFTLHGVIMIFLFVIPGLPAVFGNFFIPIMVGTDDVAYPRLNLLSYYFFLAGAILAIVSLFTGKGFPDTGWTFYVPFSVQTGTNVTLAMFAAFLIGFSSILTGLNFITTIHLLRAKGLKFFKMPLFVWAIYSTSWIQLLATPVIGMTLLLVAIERLFNVGIFDPSRGGDPILYQHLFWIYSHPAVYIMILPAMGVISEIIPTFARRKIFGYKAIAFASLSIAFFGSLVWAHHMFTSGMSAFGNFIFSLLTMVVAVPSAVKIFNWTLTLYKGSISIQPPLLFALGFMVLFGIGGLTGAMQGALVINQHIHDTYFIVGHFHYTMFGGTGFGLFAALLYWYPKMFGKNYNKKLATLSFIIMFIGFNLFYFTMLILGFEGMPRRYFDHLEMFHNGHVIASIGAFILASGVFLFLYTIISGLFSKEKALDNPYQAKGIEWQIPSPPIKHNFSEEVIFYDMDGEEDDG